MMINKKGIMLLDNFSGNRYLGFEEDLSSIKNEVLYLPSNATDKLQPLDSNINKIFKQKYQQKWMDYQLLILDNQTTKLSHGESIKFLSEIWDEITKECQISLEMLSLNQEKKMIKICQVKKNNKMFQKNSRAIKKEMKKMFLFFIFNDGSIEEIENQSQDYLEEEIPIQY